MAAMLSPLLACLPLVLAQNDARIRPTSHDRVLELEISEYDEPAIDGHGPTVYAEYEVGFDGALHVWTSSDLDLFLRIDDALAARPLASDENSGGGTTPYVTLDVHVGDVLVAFIAGTPGSTGALSLHMVAGLETEAGRATARIARDASRTAASLVTDGRRAEAREWLGKAASTITQRPAMEHPDALIAAFEVGVMLYDLGDARGAQSIWNPVLAAYERTLPADHEYVLAARNNLASTMADLGDQAGALGLRQSVLAARERTLPEHSADLLDARANLANSMFSVGDVDGARALRESVVLIREQILRADHPQLLKAQGNLARSMHEMGDMADARALRETVAAGFERILPEGHPYLLLARANLAVSLRAMGDLVGARALWESNLPAYEKALPADHPDLLRVRMNLGIVMSQMGDLAGAHVVHESVLAALERTLPEDDRRILAARTNLACSMRAIGDMAGAYALRLTILADHEKAYPEGNPHLLSAQSSLASSMADMGDFAGAQETWKRLHEIYTQKYPENHPELLTIRSYMGVYAHQAGDAASARVLFESVLTAQEETLPPDHPSLLMTRCNVGHSMLSLGDAAGARDLWTSNLAARQRALPIGHPTLLAARMNMAIACLLTDDVPGAQAILADVVGGMQVRVLDSLALAPRQSRQVVARESSRLSRVLTFGVPATSGFVRSSFELAETMRLVAGEAARALARPDADPERARILGQAALIRRALNDLVAGASPEGMTGGEFHEQLTSLALKRDALERDASRRMAERGLRVTPVRTSALSAALEPGDVAVGYYRATDHMLAHVLTSRDTLERIDLGPTSELEELANAWRAALGAPLARGVATADRPDNRERSLGAQLRARILDPILASCGDDVRRLFVCPDDLLFLLPLDALPDADKGNSGDSFGDSVARLGDRLSIVNEVSFARLLRPAPAALPAPSLVALGGVNYDMPGAGPEGPAPHSAPIDVAVGDAMRAAFPTRFQLLLQSHFEAEATAALFKMAFDASPTLLTQKDTSKARLFEAAAGTRYLHIATHGWFASENVRSTEDNQPGARGFDLLGPDELLIGLAPMTLCGLALAGANNGRDSLGRVPGILTAEELCSLDLSRCELAVLSACETNVGIRRAGQGIQSLQSALHAAGARTSITSLWKVDDAATRRLMEVFYTKLWIEKMGKAESLWQAKQTLRDEGHPPAHWAGWVLTGDPE
ncbi:MAG: CHAT domain-containing protein/tetratricopeptide (TPR) repeat protein [Planctomycetota bacterium]|jgi:CHAT domain-containing protein/tetratricopeptide (TPR) repeat protein